MVSLRSGPDGSASPAERGQKMSIGARPLTLFLLVGLTVGCAGPTPQDLAAAARGREQAARLLGTFAVAVRLDAPELVPPLLAPTLGEGKARELERQVEGVIWLRRYTGYALDAEGALADAGWRKWREGPVRLKVPCTNADGQRFEDEFELTMVDRQWRIRDFRLSRPREGDALDLPDAVADQVWPQVRSILNNMKEGHVSDVYYQLPDKPACRYRPPKLSWWERLLGRGPGGWLNIYRDLDRMKRFIVSEHWPEPQDARDLVRVPPDRFMAVYEVPYVWPEGGIEQTDTLRIELVFRNVGDTWTFYTLRLSCAGIPYS